MDWKPIPGYEGYYDISNFGLIYSHIKRKILKQKIESNGYYRIMLCKNTHRKTWSVGRLVAISFVKNNDNKPCINHIDGNKRNNDVKNIEWATHQENTRHLFDVLGHKITDEQKQKQSESTRGEKSYWFGKHHSKETIEKKRQFMLGRKLSSETRNKMKLSQQKRRIREKE